MTYDLQNTINFKSLPGLNVAIANENISFANDSMNEELQKQWGPRGVSNIRSTLSSDSNTCLVCNQQQLVVGRNLINLATVSEQEYRFSKNWLYIKGCKRLHNLL
jgi:hypothetical protein